MISVVVPVLNESQTIGAVVEFGRRDGRVAEVIVVDDGSIDGTPEQARAAGAKVITSTLLGKGASMEDGLRCCRHEIVLFLDGDLSGLCEDLVERMTRPIIDGSAEFVKAKFSRSAGRITTLTARPLLQTFFPELAHIEQPLGGIVAARRTLLSRLRFENDYGVDVGLLLDAAKSGTRIEQADIGHVDHDSHPLEVLGDMAMQVVRTLLDRAGRYGRLRIDFVREVAEVERHKQAEVAVALQAMGTVEKLALFDMDGVLLDGRFVVELADRLGKRDDLSEFLDHPTLQDAERTRRIASLFAGITRAAFERVAREIPLVAGACEAVVGLRKQGFRVGIVTDSYRVASEIVRRRVFADFSVAHVMCFRRGHATGEITLAPAMCHPFGCRFHDYCKSNVLKRVSEQMQIGPERVLAVGDGANDICMLRSAGTSIAFRPKMPTVNADHNLLVIDNLTDIVGIATRLEPVTDRVNAAAARFHAGAQSAESTRSN